MSFIRIFLSACCIIATVYFSYVEYRKEIDKKQLRNSNNIVYAEILELRCGKKDFIKFRYNEEEVSRRIYLTVKECDKLKAQKKIGLKIGENKSIVFANDTYNDWSEAEFMAILALAAFAVVVIFYYGITPEIKKRKKIIH